MSRSRESQSPHRNLIVDVDHNARTGGSEILLDDDIDSGTPNHDVPNAGREGPALGQIAPAFEMGDEHKITDVFLPRSLILDRELQNFVPSDLSNEILSFVGLEPLLDWKEENKLVLRRVLRILAAKMIFQVCVSAISLAIFFTYSSDELLVDAVVAYAAFSADPIARVLLWKLRNIPHGVSEMKCYVLTPLLLVVLHVMYVIIFRDDFEQILASAHVAPFVALIFDICAFVSFSRGRVVVPRRVHNAKKASCLANRHLNVAVGRSFVLIDGARMNEMKAFGMMQPPARWPLAGPLQVNYFKQTLDILAVEAFAYKNAYTLCFTIRRPKYRPLYRILCCIVSRDEKIYTPMDPVLVESIFSVFRHNGREDELTELQRHLNRNLKEVPFIRQQLCFANIGIVFRNNGATKIHFVQR